MPQRDHIPIIRETVRNIVLAHLLPRPRPAPVNDNDKVYPMTQG